MGSCIWYGLDVGDWCWLHGQNRLKAWNRLEVQDWDRLDAWDDTRDTRDTHDRFNKFQVACGSMRHGTDKVSIRSQAVYAIEHLRTTSRTTCYSGQYWLPTVPR